MSRLEKKTGDTAATLERTKLEKTTRFAGQALRYLSPTLDSPERKIRKIQSRQDAQLEAVRDDMRKTQEKHEQYTIAPRFKSISTQSWDTDAHVPARDTNGRVIPEGQAVIGVENTTHLRQDVNRPYAIVTDHETTVFTSTTRETRNIEYSEDLFTREKCEEKIKGFENDIKLQHEQTVKGLLEKAKADAGITALDEAAKHNHARDRAYIKTQDETYQKALRERAEAEVYIKTQNAQDMQERLSARKVMSSQPIGSPYYREARERLARPIHDYQTIDHDRYQDALNASRRTIDDPKLAPAYQTALNNIARPNAYQQQPNYQTALQNVANRQAGIEAKIQEADQKLAKDLKTIKDEYKGSKDSAMLIRLQVREAKAEKTNYSNTEATKTKDKLEESAGVLTANRTEVIAKLNALGAILLRSGVTPHQVADREGTQRQSDHMIMAGVYIRQRLLSQTEISSEDYQYMRDHLNAAHLKYTSDTTAGTATGNNMAEQDKKDLGKIVGELKRLLSDRKVALGNMQNLHAKYERYKNTNHDAMHRRYRELILEEQEKLTEKQARFETTQAIMLERKEQMDRFYAESKIPSELRTQADDAGKRAFITAYDNHMRNNPAPPNNPFRRNIIDAAEQAGLTASAQARANVLGTLTPVGDLHARIDSEREYHTARLQYEQARDQHEAGRLDVEISNTRIKYLQAVRDDAKEKHASDKKREMEYLERIQKMDDASIKQGKDLQIEQFKALRLAQLEMVKQENILKLKQYENLLKLDGLKVLTKTNRQARQALFHSAMLSSTVSGVQQPFTQAFNNGNNAMNTMLNSMSK